MSRRQCNTNWKYQNSFYRGSREHSLGAVQRNCRDSSAYKEQGPQNDMCQNDTVEKRLQAATMAAC